ncbi:MAG TPA: hypothetical protein VNA19_07625, partial [Pyrinomonadaceae bacterium]|nr:hypothetical protein [Pyrinomonadaceae bacterium]
MSNSNRGDQQAGTGPDARGRRADDKESNLNFEASSVAGQTRPRRLLLCLDGVPHEIIEASRGRGMFDSFGNTARLLSPFPTMTNVALSTMLSASAPLGYESLYFDKQARELRGG